MKLNRFKFKHWTISVICLLIISLFLVACGTTEPETLSVGVVNLAPPLDSALAGFKEGMTELGYIEGENITYIYEGATGSIDKLDAVAQGLVAADVDLILSITTPATQAAKRATAETDIPVVFVPVTDPVAADIVQSLIHPGGNITGITTAGSEEPRLQWQLKIEPTIKKIYIPYNPDGSSTVSLAAVEAAAAELDVELVPQQATTPDEVATAIETMPADMDAIFVLNDGFMESQIDQLIAASLERKIPLSASGLSFVEKGMLFSFGHRHKVNGQLAARLADQIFKGADPAELPVERAEMFLSVNLEVAKTLGLEISDDVLEAADTIIR